MRQYLENGKRYVQTITITITTIISYY